jgi:hypothetical protein
VEAAGQGFAVRFNDTLNWIDGGMGTCPRGAAESEFAVEFDDM